MLCKFNKYTFRYFCLFNQFNFIFNPLLVTPQAGHCTRLYTEKIKIYLVFVTIICKGDKEIFKSIKIVLNVLESRQ